MRRSAFARCAVAACAGALLVTAAAVSAETRMSRPLAPREVNRAAPGTSVILMLREGAVEGTIAGSGRNGDREYAPRFDSWSAARGSGSWLPALGEPVVLARDSVPPTAARFRGYAFRGIEIMAAEDSVPRFVPYSAFVSLGASSGAASIAADSLDRMDARSELPSRTEVLVRTTRGVVHVPMDRVLAVRLPADVAPTGAALAAAGVAAGVGIGVWAVVAALGAVAVGLTMFFAAAGKLTP